MTRNVLVTVTGYQNSPQSGEDTIEIMAPGSYYFKGGKHILLYEEAMDETQAMTKNLVKFTPGYLEVTKSGQVETHMLFMEGQETLSHYATQFGDIQMGFRTSDVVVYENEDSIQVCACYAMDVNCQFAADCRLTIQIRSCGKQE